MSSAKEAGLAVPILTQVCESPAAVKYWRVEWVPYRYPAREALESTKTTESYCKAPQSLVRMAVMLVFRVSLAIQSAFAIQLESTSLISSGGNGQVTITADSLNMPSGITSIKAGTSGTADASIRPLTAGTKIDLGGTDVLSGSPLTLGLTDAELDRITAGTLTIGDANSGAMTVSGDISRSASTHMQLQSGGAISLAAGLNTVGGNITLTAGDAITQTAGILETIGTLTPNHGAGKSATFNSSGNKVTSFVIPVGMTSNVDGSFDSTGFVQVNGTLAGKGSVGTVTVASTGKVTPGTSPGKLTTGNIALNSLSEFTVELNGNTPGTTYDQLVVNGTVNLGGAKLFGSVSYLPPTAQVFKIIDNDGSDTISTTFDALAEGATVTFGLTSSRSTTTAAMAMT